MLEKEVICLMLKHVDELLQVNMLVLHDLRLL